eukprot:12984400-Alexandrium_andersonii.AAC.1
MLGPKLDSRSCESASAGVEPACRESSAEPRVRRADVSDAHEKAQWSDVDGPANAGASPPTLPTSSRRRTPPSSS